MIILDFYCFFISSGGKNWPLPRGYFGSWGQTLVAAAVVERWPFMMVRRFNYEFMYGLSAGTKNKRPLLRDGYCGEVTVSGGSTVHFHYA